MTATEQRLPSFENNPVAKATVRITKAGDGLSESMKLDPQPLHYGEEVFFVLRGRVRQINHRPLSTDDGDFMVRQHTVEAEEIVLVAPDQVEEFFVSERTRLKRLQDQAEARAPLPGIDNDEPPPVEDVVGEPNIFGGTFDERGPIEDGQADEQLVHGHTGLPFTPSDEKPARRPRKGSLAAGLELIASITDASELFALMDEEERGKNRKAVMDAAAARIAELAAEQEAAEVQDLVAEAEAGDASDYGAH